MLRGLNLEQNMQSEQTLDDYDRITGSFFSLMLDFAIVMQAIDTSTATD